MRKLVQLFSCWRGENENEDNVETFSENKLKANAQEEHETGSQKSQHALNGPSASAPTSTLPSTSPAPSPSPFEPWAQNPLFAASTAEQHDPAQCFRHVRWEEHLVESIPFSCAIVTSDAKEVLFKKHGLEPAAAQLLNRALLFNSVSRPLNAPLSRKAAEDNCCSTCSFLVALLGPELEAVALSTARTEREGYEFSTAAHVQAQGNPGNRFWKGAISVEHPLEVEEAQSCSTAAISAHCEDPPGIMAVEIGAEGSTDKEAEAGEGAAGARTAETQQIAASSLGVEGPLGSAGTISLMTSIIGKGGGDSVSAPTNLAAEWGRAAGTGGEVRQQKHAAAQEAAVAVQAAAAAAAKKAAAAAAAREAATAAARGSAVAAVPSSAKGRRASAPDIPAEMRPGQKAAFPEPSLKRDWSERRPSNFESKNVRWGSPGESLTTKFPQFGSCDSRPCVLEKSMQDRPSSPAQTGSTTEQEASQLRISPIRSSKRMPCSPHRSSTSTYIIEDDGGGGVMSGDAGDSTLPSTARSSDISKPSLRRSKSSGANPRAYSQRSSLIMSNEAIRQKNHRLIDGD